MRGMRLVVASGVIVAGALAGPIVSGWADVATAPAATAAATQSAGIKDATIDFEKLLKNFAKRTYSFGKTVNGEFVAEGEFILTTTVEKDAVVFEDTITSTRKQGEWKGKSTHAKDGALTLRKLEVSVAEGDRAMTMSLEVKDGVGTFRMTRDANEPEEKTVSFPENSVTLMGLLRLFTVLPREEGGAWRVAALYNDFKGKMRVAPGGETMLMCTGAETITVGGRAIACTRFELHTKDRVMVDAWVDEAGVLQRVVFDGRESLELKAEAAK